MDFDQARRRATENLAGQTEDIRGGRVPQALEPFAKAYLGLFLDIDENLEPAQRVDLLADEPLASAIREGFVAVLQRADLPTPKDIGARFARGQRLALGYVVLAGTDIVARDGRDALLALPEATLAAALCFYHINTPSHRLEWGARLLAERPGLCAEALQRLWHELIPTVSDHLPGLRPVLHNADAAAIRQELVLPLLLQWTHCKQTVLRELLLVALRSSGHGPLLDATRRRLQGLDETDVKKWIYWLTCAYLLSPGEFEQQLADYAGRWRGKTLPLLDFSVAVLAQERESGLCVGPQQVAHLLRIIAPTFRRNAPLTGGLDAVSGKVMELFERLARDSSPEASEAVRVLQNVRVMKIYEDVLEDVAARQQAHAQ